MVEDLNDPRRTEPAFTLADRQMLEAWLEFHRATLLLKCEGLDDAGRKRRPVESSLLSLHGLVRHMAEVEHGWFQRGIAENPELPTLYCETDEDADLVPLDEADWDSDLATWQEECEKSRATAAAVQLDEIRRGRRSEITLRWVYCHMIEEYARHNGHADLIRELVDGSVGW
jgi:uncharacterized damage-inducible protein DinB